MSLLIQWMLVLSSLPGANAEDMSVQDMRQQVILQVQTLVTSLDGKQIQYISPSWGKYSSRAKRGDISSLWMDNPPGFSPVRLEFVFKVNEDKSLALTVTQYSSVQLDAKSGNITRKEGKGKSETFILNDFGSVSWTSETVSGARVVTRFTPLVSEESSPVKLTYVPMSLADVIIADNSGKVWAEGMSADGEVIKFQTFYGTLYLSFTEFAGSIEIGRAKGGSVELWLTEALTVRIRSERAVLGSGIAAKVFGKYLPTKKTAARAASSISAMSAASAVKELKLQ